MQVPHTELFIFTSIKYGYCKCKVKCSATVAYPISDLPCILYDSTHAQEQTSLKP